MHEIPSSLEKIQYWFSHLITSPILESDADLIPIFSPNIVSEIRQKIAPGPTLSSEERMGIYKQQYWWRLISVMQELFPSLVALLDYKKFNRLIAEPYLSTHIPQDWFISNIGLDLPKWLKASTLKRKLLLIELAKLDLIYERLLFAEILPFVDPARCEKETIYLQPFVMLFKLNPDLLAFRDRLIQEQKQPSPPPKKRGKKRFVVLYRLNEKNHYEEIDSLFFKLLSRFQKGAKLKEIIHLLEKCKDVTSLFQTMTRRGWLTHSCPKATDRSI